MMHDRCKASGHNKGQRDRTCEEALEPSEPVTMVCAAPLPWCDAAALFAPLISRANFSAYCRSRSHACSCVGAIFIEMRLHANAYFRAQSDGAPVAKLNARYSTVRHDNAGACRRDTHRGAGSERTSARVSAPSTSAAAVALTSPLFASSTASTSAAP